MRRFLWIWLTLLGGFWVAQTGVSLAASGWVAWRDEASLLLVTVPALQALALWWVTRERGADPRGFLRSLLTPWLGFWLAWDLLIAALGWLLPEHPFFTLHGGGNLAGVHNLLKGLATGLVAAAFARRETSPRDRRWTFLLAAWLPLLGSAFLFAWPDRLAAGLAPPLPPLLSTLAVYGGLLAVSVGLALRLQPVWVHRAPAPARLLDLAAGLALLAAVLGAAHLVLAPEEPWPLAARICAFFALTAALLACLGAALGRDAEIAEEETF